MTEYDPYRAVQLWIERYGLVKAQQDSFSSFVDHISTVLHDEPNLNVCGNEIAFENVTFVKPSYIVNGKTLVLYPTTARLQNLDYEFTVRVDVVNLTKGTRENIELCRLPSMVFGKMCNLHDANESVRVAKGELVGDPGGYFIHNGVERVLIGHIRPAYNTINVYRTRSEKLVCQLRSMNEETAKSKSIVLHRAANGAYVIEFDGSNGGGGAEAPKSRLYLVSDVFKGLLGGSLDRLHQYVGGENCMLAAVDELKYAPENLQCYSELTDAVRESVRAGHKGAAIMAVVKRAMLAPKRTGGRTAKCATTALYARLEPIVKRLVEQKVDSNDIVVAVNGAIRYRIPECYDTMFMHIGISADNDARAYYLGCMLTKYVTVEMGVREEESREQYSKKRVDFAGSMCLDLFKMTWKQFLIDVVNKSNDKCNPINAINSVKRNITNHFKMCFVHGRWGAKSAEHKTIGIVESISMRTSIATSIDSVRRMKLQVHKENKDKSIRQMFTSHAFFACCVETTEGTDVGIRLALALVAFASVRQPTMLVREFVETCLSNMLHSNVAGCYANGRGRVAGVLVNGTPVGYVSEPNLALNILRRLRNLRCLNDDVSISHDTVTDTIEVWCDAGRFVRPLLYCRDGDDVDALKERVMLADNASELFANGDMVHRDAIELCREHVAITTHVAKRDRVSYIELNPNCMFGLLAAQIPFANYSPSPRACYKTNMARQSMGVLPSLGDRNGTASSISLNYGQKPIVTTRCASICGVDDTPNGVNAIVAVMCYTGFNQEDSVIINKSSLDRGMFQATQRKDITVSLQIGTVVDELCKPPVEMRMDANYDRVGDDGLPIIGGRPRKGDVVVAKVSPDKSTGRKEDTSVVSKGQDDCVVKSVRFIGSTIKIRVEETLHHRSEDTIGDKFCSAMAQKGICGMVLAQEDMPFVPDSGMVPDIIVNSHSMPSRMTVNQMMASVAGKLACVAAKRVDGSSFQNDEYDDLLAHLCEQLSSVEFDGSGAERMCCGATGVEFPYDVFIGVVYYLRPVQLVKHKKFSSTTTATARNRLTRQPLNGRAHEGGLRVGEMEKDDLLCHGAVSFLMERMLDLSDAYTMRLCTTCGSESQVVKRNDNGYVCTRCKTLTVSELVLPYSAKLLHQNLQAIGVGCRYVVKRHDHQ
ncbi:128.1 kDa DNA-directed RNA polymerase II subunit 2 [Spodoptera frugiperda ascovirus 1a]|uniref:DNA-directed RNA polymerase n=1 Tax=Spodoptera frugiperda ascovirus 1a TaxID=113370 RepID=Q0E549_SFAVA|nr:128.1 kDa DNA-directed RNA polymerase II subunit 2 [Spodoptera frugiperda ascovirus 1a]CAL44652.1 128.1 kDa DNA-directed RNA polymerase II subunit 2 [Spodoptera frugiperda ascovirus 1a]